MDVQHHMEARYLIERNRVREHELRAIRVHRDRNSPLHGLTQDDAAKRHKRLLRLDRAFLGSLEDLCAQQDFRRYQSGQPTVFSGTYIITVLQYACTLLILQHCGRSGPTGTFGNSVPPTKPRTQARGQPVRLCVLRRAVG